MEGSPSAQDWTAEFWPLTTGVSTDSFSNIMTSSSSSSLQPQRAAGTGLTLGRLDLVGQKVVAESSSTSDTSAATTNAPQPSPSPDSKRRGSDTARKDRSNVLKAYLMDVGCTKIRGARKRRKNEDGEYEGGKIDWDSEWVQEQLVIPLEEFKAIRLDYERRSKEKKLTDATIERDWVTKDGVRIPKAKMLKNYYPTNLVLHRFFDLMHGKLLQNHRVSPHIEEQMQNINPFMKTRPLALYLPDDGQGHLAVFRGHMSRTDPLVMLYTHDGKENLEIDGRFFFHDQRSVLARPELQAIHYLDDVLVKGVARRLRAEEELMALWQSAFGKGQSEEVGPREVEVNLFLSCFTESFRATLRYLFLAPYENKMTVTFEEFQTFFLWAAGLTDGALSVQDQLKALVQELKCTSSHAATGRPIRDDIVIYITTSKAKPLKKPGDYYLRASTTQAGWIAVEYVPPLTGSAAVVAASAAGEGSSLTTTPQPQASLFYFQVTVDSKETRVYFTDRKETHPNIVSLLLKHTGTDSWGRLHQCCAIKTPPPPPPVLSLKDILAPMGMIATPFGQTSEASPSKVSSAAALKKQGGAAPAMTVDGAGMLAPSPSRHRHSQSQSRRQGSLDSLGLMPGLSSLDLPHSFGVGPSWRSTDHHLDALLQPDHSPTHTHQLPPPQEAHQLLPQVSQQQPPRQQPAVAHAQDTLSLGIFPSLQLTLPHHPPQDDHQPSTHTDDHLHQLHHLDQTHTNTHTHQQQQQQQQQPIQPLPAQLHLSHTDTHSHTHPPTEANGAATNFDMGPPYYYTRSAASSDRLNQMGGVFVSLDDPFPLQDFLVSSTSSFGSLGLSSLAASTPGQLTGSSSSSGGGQGVQNTHTDTQNRFFVDQLVSGVDHMHMHMRNNPSGITTTCSSSGEVSSQDGSNRSKRHRGNDGKPSP